MDKQITMPAPLKRSTNYVRGIAAAVMLLAVVGGGYFTLRSLQAKDPVSCEPEEQSYLGGDPVHDGYKKWEKPLVALVLSGQMHGYYDPCGCSFPQHGGLTRRYNFIDSLKKKEWPVVGIDLGELATVKGI